ncbi:hypothetical protein PCASD_20475 [Puccinia coronata f. sp. avenae]|uniref:Uncharacterized protein n=1 Tax=Puccinia coronata f. sp. avenae TaxID=200324 RepID=A0A2N5TVR4_9BASI|nr:hypothetical protein PCASD_20475 [Puccinia coronata f. sp. avenae]
MQVIACLGVTARAVSGPQPAHRADHAPPAAACSLSSRGLLTEQVTLYSVSMSRLAHRAGHGLFGEQVSALLTEQVTPHLGVHGLLGRGLTVGRDLLSEQAATSPSRS